MPSRSTHGPCGPRPATSAFTASSTGKWIRNSEYEMRPSCCSGTAAAGQCAGDSHRWRCATAISSAVISAMAMRLRQSMASAPAPTSASSATALHQVLVRVARPTQKASMPSP
ncbi:hypothetical protein FQZ97_572920 [compost metagenome]